MEDWKKGRVGGKSPFFHPSYPSIWQNRFPFSMDKHLLPNQQLARGGAVACGECVEINTARHSFTQRVSTIPIRRTTAAFMETCRLISDYQMLLGCINCQCDIRGRC